MLNVFYTKYIMSLFRKAVNASQYLPSSIFRKVAVNTAGSLFKKAPYVKDNPTGATLAKASYLVGEKGKSPEAIAETNKMVASTGFELVPDLSNRQISTFKNKEGNYTIAHKGTCLSCPSNYKDIKTDLALSLGFNTKQVKNRTKRTEEILDMIDQRNPDAKVNMTGHSLGGHTSSYAMAKSKKVRDRINKASTFNTGSNPFLNAGLNVDKDTRKTLDNKVVNYRKRNDIISAGLITNPQFGKTKTYSNNLLTNPLKAHEIEQFI